MAEKTRDRETNSEGPRVPGATGFAGTPDSRRFARKSALWRNSVCLTAITKSIGLKLISHVKQRARFCFFITEVWKEAHNGHSNLKMPDSVSHRTPSSFSIRPRTGILFLRSCKSCLDKRPFPDFPVRKFWTRRFAELPETLIFGLFFNAWLPDPTENFDCDGA